MTDVAAYAALCPGGFGITYLALDTKLETRIAIKEYLPRDQAGRDAGHATLSAYSAEDGEFFRYGLPSSCKKPAPWPSSITPTSCG